MKSKRKYSSKLKHFARENRKSPTFSENKLWNELRGRRLLGFKFRRQFPYKNYILDFYSEELKLCIELDGFSHQDEKFEKDLTRDKVLRVNGINVLRFSEFDVKANLENVLSSIVNYINVFTSTSSPTRRG